jgi:hypothetical protein
MMDGMRAPAAAGGGTLGQGLIMHYLMNDNAATAVVLNTTTNMGNGVLRTNNTDQITGTGKINGALTNNGIYHIETALTNQVENVTHSVAFWLKVRSSTDNQRLFGMASYGYAWVFANSVLYCSIFDAAGSGGTHYTAALTNSADGNWHHFVVGTDWGTSNSVLWVDGTNKSSLISYTKKYTAPQRDLSEPMLLWHSYTGNKKFNGWMDDFRVYTRLLTTNEVLELYNGGAGTEEE